MFIHNGAAVLATSGRDAQGDLKTRRPEFGEFILVQQEEGGPLAEMSPPEEEGGMGGVGGKATSSLHKGTLVEAGSNGGRQMCETRQTWVLEKVPLAQPEETTLRERRGETEPVCSWGEGRGGRRKERMRAPDSGGGGAQPCPPPASLSASLLLARSSKDTDTQTHRHGHVGAGPSKRLRGGGRDGGQCVLEP